LTEVRQEYKGIARTRQKDELEEIPEEQLDTVFFQNTTSVRSEILKIMKELKLDPAEISVLTLSKFLEGY